MKVAEPVEVVPIRARRPRGINRRAAEATIAAHRQAGRLDDAHRALTVAVLTAADTLDREHQRAESGVTKTYTLAPTLRAYLHALSELERATRWNEDEDQAALAALFAEELE